MIRRCKIKDIGYFFGGLTGKNKDDFNIGNAKYVSYMTVFSNSRLPDSITDIVSISKNEKQNKIQKGDVLFTGSSETPDECGMSCVVTKDVVGDVYLNSFCFGLRFHNNEILNSSYLAHYFRSNYARKQISKTANGVTRFNISKKLFSEIEIVYPSIKVQEEIVEILDSFTNLIDALNEELSLRQKQFEYYREKLLKYKEEFVVDTLENIAPYSKKRISSEELNENNYVGVDNLLKNKEGKTNSKNVPISGNLTRYEKGDILIGNIRPYLKKIWYADNVGGASGDVLVFSIKEKELIDSRYLYYILSSDEFFDFDNSTARGGSMPRGDKKVICKYSIWYPKDIGIQQSIVEKLDAFESLISSLKEEIALRQKQYEYYREKLLTFD